MRVQPGLATAIAVVCVTLVCVTSVACGSSPTAPTGPTVPGASGSSTPVARLELETPASIAPGTTVQLRAFAVYGDGRREEVTARAEWRATLADVLAVDGGGRATGRRAGEAAIDAIFGGRSLRQTVLVLPADTWRLRGHVHDGFLGIANVRVEVVAGIGTGATATTDANGYYALYGVGVEVVVRASAESFLATDVTRSVASNDASLDIALLPSGPARTLSGEWALTFEAAAVCRYPASVQQRTYRATIEQMGASLTFLLSGAEFAPDRSVPPTLQNRFHGRVLGDVLTIELKAVVDYSRESTVGRWDVAEASGPNTILTFRGTGSATANGSVSWSGSFSGGIYLISEGPGPYDYSDTSCERSDHWFSLAKAR